MKLLSKPFDMIAKGDKTIELRLYDEKRRQIKVGDTICFTKTDDINKKLFVSVVALHKFNSFKELYKSLPLLKCGYTMLDVANAKAEDMNIIYSLEKQDQYGVLGIELRLM